MIVYKTFQTFEAQHTQTLHKTNKKKNGGTKKLNVFPHASAKRDNNFKYLWPRYIVLVEFIINLGFRIITYREHVLGSPLVVDNIVEVLRIFQGCPFVLIRSFQVNDIRYLKGSAMVHLQNLTILEQRLPYQFLTCLHDMLEIMRLLALGNPSVIDSWANLLFQPGLAREAMLSFFVEWEGQLGRLGV